MSGRGLSGKQIPEVLAPLCSDAEDGEGESEVEGLPAPSEGEDSNKERKEGSVEDEECESEAGGPPAASEGEGTVKDQGQRKRSRFLPESLGSDT